MSPYHNLFAPMSHFVGCEQCGDTLRHNSCQEIPHDREAGDGLVIAWDITFYRSLGTRTVLAVVIHVAAAPVPRTSSSC